MESPIYEQAKDDVQARIVKRQLSRASRFRDRAGEVPGLTRPCAGASPAAAARRDRVDRAVPRPLA